MLTNISPDWYILIGGSSIARPKPYLWQTDTAVAKNSWCYTEENVYKSSVQILQDLVDIVSKNGRMMLNIGPKADGTIPEEDKRILLEIGDWLRTNGKAIYGAKLWRKSSEGPTIIQEGQFADSEAKNYTAEDISFTVKYGLHISTDMVSDERPIVFEIEID